MTDEKTFVVLLVEDEAAHAELVRRGFEEAGGRYRLMHVADGESALDYLFRRGLYAEAEASPRPHMVLLDLRLPRKEGFDVLEEVKASVVMRDIPVVILTASQAQEDAARAYALYANSVIVKPADYDEFSTLIREMSRYWRHWNFYVAPRATPPNPLLRAGR